MNLLAQIQTESADYSGLKVMLPLSGGINSAALLCWLGEEIAEDKKPGELHLYYSHFVEHSPDTHQFVIDLILYAGGKFRQVNSKITWNSSNAYFIEQNFIPHPTKSPCSVDLKVKPAKEYFIAHDLDIELVGYVKTDLIKRGKKKQSRFDRLSANKNFAHFPILEWSKQDCIDYVKPVIGWYPAIYDIKDERGKDVFSHNNCLPCKNMHEPQIEAVGKYFPQYLAEAQKVTEKTGCYWGREGVPDVFKCDTCERFN